MTDVGQADRARDPRVTVDTAPMSRLQIGVVAIAMGLNALDGFDVLSISFAAPGIAAQWGVNRAALGVVLSMELIGMAIGSMLLGGLADRIGRRRLMVGALALMMIGMVAASRASGIGALSAWRVLTGLGIGGMLATVNAVTAEFANARRRTLCVALMTIGYPLGAVLGGSVATTLLRGGDWRAVFEFGALVTAAFIPVVWLCVPESVHYLIDVRAAGGLPQVNRTLARMGHPPVAVLPERSASQRGQSAADILGGSLRRATLLMTAGYFAHAVTFYFILKWAPKIVVDLGFDASAAAGVLVWGNVGGAAGGAIFGLLAQRIDLKRLTVLFLACSSASVVAFGTVGTATLAALSTTAALACFFGNAVVVGYYASFARAFPTHVRATGTGFAIGIGRGGAALSPALAGLLFTGGVGLGGVAIAMAAGSLISLTALALLRSTPKAFPA